MSDADTTASRSGSRSQSRRRRRRQNQRTKASAKAETRQAPVQEEQADEELPPNQLNNPATADTTEMQPFERIKPPSQSMDGPVTYARAQRGEIPMRNGQMAPPQPQQAQKSGSGDMMEQDGLKLRLELNLDIEIELKASIHGDLTLAIVN